MRRRGFLGSLLGVAGGLALPAGNFLALSDDDAPQRVIDPNYRVFYRTSSGYYLQAPGVQVTMLSKEGCDFNTESLIVTHKPLEVTGVVLVNASGKVLGETTNKVCLVLPPQCEFNLHVQTDRFGLFRGRLCGGPIRGGSSFMW